MSKDKGKGRTAAVKAAAGSAAQPGPKAAGKTPAAAAGVLRKRELLAEAVARSGVRKKEAKPAIEAALALLGEAVAEGRGLDLPGFGKLRLNRSIQRSNGAVHVCRLRQPDGGAGSTAAGAEENRPGGKESSPDPLAEPAEDR